MRDKSQAYDSNLSWGNKIHKLFWTGAPMIPLREEFINISTPYPWGASLTSRLRADQLQAQ